MSTDILNALSRPDIRDFIRDHAEDDVAILALKKPPGHDWPYREVLEQIRARQKAGGKLAAWMDIPGFIFPGPDTIEQASSLAAARYKAGLVKVKSFIDLTGGAGADSWAFAGKRATGIVIERDRESAARLAHNFALTHPGKVQVIENAAEYVLADLPPADLILIDPQRRDSTKRGIFRLEDGSPSVMELLPLLQEKTRYVLLKTAPFLDIAQTLEALPAVRQVHVVEHEGDCKEVLYLLDFKNAAETPPVITAARIDAQGAALHSLSFTAAEEEDAPLRIAEPGKYLYEPSPAFLKSGAFKLLASRYPVFKLGRHTHLYTSKKVCPAFPGRAFKIIEALPVRKDAMKKAIPGLKAHLAVRNFPMSVEDLRKKLALKDGGEDYLFACTLENGRKTILRARKF